MYVMKILELREFFKKNKIKIELLYIQKLLYIPETILMGIYSKQLRRDSRRFLFLYMHSSITYNTWNTEETQASTDGYKANCGTYAQLNIYYSTLKGNSSICCSTMMDIKNIMLSGKC